MLNPPNANAEMVDTATPNCAAIVPLSIKYLRIAASPTQAPKLTAATTAHFKSLYSSWFCLKLGCLLIFVFFELEQQLYAVCWGERVNAEIIKVSLFGAYIKPKSIKFC